MQLRLANRSEKVVHPNCHSTNTRKFPFKQRVYHFKKTIYHHAKPLNPHDLHPGEALHPGHRAEQSPGISHAGVPKTSNGDADGKANAPQAGCREIHLRFRSSETFSSAGAWVDPRTWQCSVANRATERCPTVASVGRVERFRTHECGMRCAWTRRCMAGLRNAPNENVDR